VGQLSDWWLNRAVTADWQLPISSFQGFRPVGGYLIGTPETIEFVPNRFEAMIGGAPWVARRDEIESITLGRRRLRIISTTGQRQTFCTNRPAAVRRLLAVHLDPVPAS
jgi:hypothetical protein